MKRSELDARIDGVTRGLKIGRVFFWLSWTIWLLDTIVFLFIDGWHAKSVPGSVEYTIDQITAIGMAIGLFWIIMESAKMASLMCDILKDELN